MEEDEENEDADGDTKGEFDEAAKEDDAANEEGKADLHAGVGREACDDIR